MPSSSEIESPPALAQILFGESAALAWSTAGQDLTRWSQAVDDWLANMNSLHGKNYALACRRILRDFLQSLHKTPWQVTSQDALTWVDRLAGQVGSVSTLRIYTSFLDQFYRFALARGLEMRIPVPASSPAGDPAGGPAGGAAGGPAGGSSDGPAEGCAFSPSNPIQAAWEKASHKPKSRMYLDEAETGALLDAIRRNLTLPGRRDYAFILCNLFGGLTFQELRTLKWGECSLESLPGGQAQSLVYQPRPVRLPADCTESVLDYLRLSGRLPGIQPGEFVFASLARLGLIPTGLREEWNGTIPIPQEYWWQILRRAATWAGLRKELVNYRLLRNTAAYLRIQAGDGPAELQAFLNLKALRHARAILKTILSTEKSPLWAEPDPDRPRERQPYAHDWKTVVKVQPLIPSPQVQAIEVLEAAPPLLALQNGVAQVRLIRDDLLENCLPQVEDSRTLASIAHGVNRVSNGIRALLPMFKKALEKQTYEEADRKRIMDLKERLERRQRGEEEEEGEQEEEVG